MITYCVEGRLSNTSEHVALCIRLLWNSVKSCSSFRWCSHRALLLWSESKYDCPPQHLILSNPSAFAFILRHHKRAWRAQSKSPFFFFFFILMLLCAAVDPYVQHSPATHGTRVVETNDSHKVRTRVRVVFTFTRIAAQLQCN